MRIVIAMLKHTISNGSMSALMKEFKFSVN